MNWIYGIVIAFVLMGFIEKVAKPISMMYTKWKILKVAPVVLDALDPIMPEMIREKTGAEIEEFLRNLLSEKTGEDWSARNIESFWKLYDVRAAADRNKVI